MSDERLFAVEQTLSQVREDVAYMRGKMESLATQKDLSKVIYSVIGSAVGLFVASVVALNWIFGLRIQALANIVGQ